jgi:hypothetical protein
MSNNYYIEAIAKLKKRCHPRETCLLPDRGDGVTIKIQRLEINYENKMQVQALCLNILSGALAKPTGNLQACMLK